MFLKKAFLALGLSALLCAPVHAAEPVTLKFSHVNAENAWSTENGLIPWMKKVEEDSQGSIRMELYANNTLTKDNQAWMAVRNGIADMAWLPMGRYPGMNPLLEVIGLGGLAYEDAMDATERVWNILDSVPAAMKPFAANRLIALYSTDTAFLLTRKPVRTLEDLRGMKIRCTSVYVGSLKALGAVPVVLGMPDVYMSLQKGVIDGLICDWESVSGFRLYDEAKYVTDNVPLGMVTFCIAMNQRVYNKLPQKAQQAGRLSLAGEAILLRFPWPATGNRSSSEGDHYSFRGGKSPLERTCRTPSVGAVACGHEQKGAEGRPDRTRLHDEVERFAFENICQS